jgi:hypothetical protein
MQEIVAAIGDACGRDVGGLVAYEPDARIQALFGSFGELRTDAAERAGFVRDACLPVLVRASLEGCG